MTTLGPQIAYLLPTGRCNLSCRGCYATLEQWGRHTKHGELDLGQYRDLIKELWQMGVRIFDISGGEPMLRPDLAEICTIIHELPETHVWLICNGTLAEEATLRRLSPLVDRLAISLDAASPSLHDRLRGKSRFL